MFIGKGTRSSSGPFGSPRDRGLYFPIVSVSDTHLLNKAATAELLLEFLMNIETDLLVLDGDIVDGWYRESHRHDKVREMHARVIDCILAKASSGTRVVYIAGNHDGRLRDVKDLSSLSGNTGIEIVPDEFETTDSWGRKVVFLHGDRFDPPMSDILYRIGDFGYETLVSLNAVTNSVLPYHLRPYFSLAAAAKKGTKWLVNVAGDFESRVVEYASKRDVDVVACGHIHVPAVRSFRRTDGKEALYANSGDWVESCTALALTPEGTYRTVFWSYERLKYGLLREPRKKDPNPFVAFRPETERIFHFFNGLCPSRDVRHLIREIQDHGDKSVRHAVLADAFSRGAHGLEGMAGDVMADLVLEMMKKSRQHHEKFEQARRALEEKMRQISSDSPIVTP